MHRACFLGFLGALVLTGIAVCLKLPSPDFGLAAIGVGILALIGLAWLALAIAERDLDAAVEFTAYVNHTLACDEKEALTEVDSRFERNSGLRRWKDSPTGLKSGAVGTVAHRNGHFQR